MADHLRKSMALLSSLCQYRLGLSAANPFGEDIRLAITMFSDAALSANDWEKENPGGITHDDQSMLDCHVREMEQGKFFDPDAGEYRNLQDGGAHG